MRNLSDPSQDRNGDGIDQSADADVNAVRALLAPADPASPTGPDDVALGQLEVARRLGQPGLTRALLAERAAPGGNVTPLAPRRGRRAVRWAAPVTVAALTLAAVGGAVALRNDPSTNGRNQVTELLASGPGANIVLASYDATRAARTAQISLTVSSGLHQLGAEGVVDFRSGAAHATAELSGMGNVEIISTGDAFYVNLAGAGALGALGGGDARHPWVKLPVGASDLLAGGAGNAQVLGVLDPGGALDYLRAVSGEVSEVGPDTVRGEATTHYQASIDPAKVAEQEGVGDARSGGADEQPVPIDVWIDGAGRLRRLVVHDDGAMGGAAGAGAGAGAEQATLTVELWDFGGAVDVAPPPADQVGDLSALAGELARRGGR